MKSCPRAATHDASRAAQSADAAPAPHHPDSAADPALRTLLRWTEDWIPRVQQGSLWMRKVAEKLVPNYATPRELILLHAADEQCDFRLLFDDLYRLSGSAPAI